MRTDKPPVGGLHGETLTRGLLAGFRLRALRRRVWFRVLDRLERGLVDLTIRYVDQVKSSRLRQVLVEILEKLVRAMESSMARALGRGRPIAAWLSDMAVGWGNIDAYSWKFEEAFQRFLGLRMANNR